MSFNSLRELVEANKIQARVATVLPGSDVTEALDLWGSYLSALVQILSGVAVGTQVARLDHEALSRAYRAAQQFRQETNGLQPAEPRSVSDVP